MGFPRPLVADEALLGEEFACSVLDRDFRLLWPSREVGTSALVAPDGVSLQLEPGLSWGEVLIESEGLVDVRVDRICLIETGGGPQVDHEDLIGGCAVFRRKLLNWLGVMSGQPLDKRWAVSPPLRDRDRIRVGLLPESGPINLSESARTTTTLERGGQGLGTQVVDRDMVELALTRSAGADPPLAFSVFQSARTAFLNGQHRTAVLEVGIALELLFWEEYRGVANQVKAVTLGALAEKLGYRKGSPTRDAIDLRNRVVHHAEKEIYYRETAEAFMVVLGHFRRRHPQVFQV